MGVDVSKSSVQGCYVSVSMLPAAFMYCKQGIIRLLTAFSRSVCIVILFRSFGGTFWPPLPSSLVNELSIDKRDSVMACFQDH